MNNPAIIENSYGHGFLTLTEDGEDIAVKLIDGTKGSVIDTCLFGGDQSHYTWLKFQPDNGDNPYWVYYRFINTLGVKYVESDYDED